MSDFTQEPAPSKTGQKFGFLLALLCALGLHVIILLVPLSMQVPDTVKVPAQIELQLTTIHKVAPMVQEPEQQPDKQPPEQEPEPLPEPIPEPDPEPAETEKFVAVPQEPVAPRLIPAPPIRELEHDFEKMTPTQKTQLTNAILSRQFITQESAADKVFGKPISPQATELQKEFHYPARQNMITMLDQPVPDLPFAYTPDLIYFAYDPGVKGDLQRFWDVITPEFGWRTNNGTEFKCKWILIIAACGWK